MNTTFPSLRLQMTIHPLLVSRVGGGLGQLDVLEVRPVEQVGELDQAILIGPGPAILSIPLRQIEGVEHIANTFTVHDKVAGDLVSANDNG